MAEIKDEKNVLAELDQLKDDLNTEKQSLSTITADRDSWKQIAESNDAKVISAIKERDEAVADMNKAKADAEARCSEFDAKVAAQVAALGIRTTAIEQPTNPPVQAAKKNWTAENAAYIAKSNSQ